MRHAPAGMIDFVNFENALATLVHRYKFVFYLLKRKI